MTAETYYEPSLENRLQRLGYLTQFDEENRRALLAIWSVLTGKPQTQLDLGCGSGAMVNLAVDCDVDAVGVDVVATAPNVQHDLRVPLHLRREFELITCIEVAEHLPADSADVLVDSIDRHLAVGGTLVFSAAIPGQQGINHVNCQQPYYWRQRFWAKKINYQPELTTKLAFMWTLVTGALMHLPANVQVFIKEGGT